VTRSLLLTALVCAVALIGAVDADAARSKPGGDPVELWRSFPLGHKASQAAPLVARAGTGSGIAHGASAAAAGILVRSKQGSAFPLTLAVALSGGFGLLVVIAVLRWHRREPGGSVVVVGDPPPRPFGHYSIVRTWHEDVEGRFRRVDPKKRERRDASARDEFRQRLLGSVASAEQTWNRFASQHPERRRRPVSDTSLESPATSESGGEEGAPSPDDVHAADLGDRINDIIRAAEAAAAQIRADAEERGGQITRLAEVDAQTRVTEAEAQRQRHKEAADAYAKETREAVDSYATGKRREADADAARIHAEAEAQARATREAAEEMAKRIHGEARERVADLTEQAAAIEERLEGALRGVREVAGQLESLLDREPKQSLTSALAVERHVGANDRER
jgi:hypothetical protein